MYMQYIFHILHPAMESFYVKGIEIMIFEFLSNEETIFLKNFRQFATNKEELKKIGITHVVNCAKGTRPGQIDTDASFFKDVAIQYLGLQAKDILTYDISKHFEKAANFIDQALSKGGKKLPTGVCVSTLEIGLL